MGLPILIQHSPSVERCIPEVVFGSLVPVLQRLHEVVSFFSPFGDASYGLILHHHGVRSVFVCVFRDVPPPLGAFPLMCWDRPEGLAQQGDMRALAAVPALVLLAYPSLPYPK